MASPASALEIDALVFDVIGTLVDEDAVFSATATALAAAAGLDDAAALWRSWVRLLDARMSDVVSASAPWRPHAELVAEAARAAVLEHGGVPTPQVDAALAGIDGEYPAWPDVAEGLRALRPGRLVAGYSNGELSSLARLAVRNDLAWHAVLSTSEVGTFKPADSAYRHVIDALRLDPARSLFVAAHPWDLRAAARHGFRTAYVRRPAAERPAAQDSFDIQVASIADLAHLLRRS